MRRRRGKVRARRAVWAGQSLLYTLPQNLKLKGQNSSGPFGIRRATTVSFEDIHLCVFDWEIMPPLIDSVHSVLFVVCV